MPLTDLNLINVFKFKLFQLYFPKILPIFHLPEPLAFYQLALFANSSPVSSKELLEHDFVLRFYNNLTFLKHKQLRAEVFLAKFATAKYTFKDFRTKPAKPVDFKISTDLMRIGDTKIFDRIKRAAAVTLTPFNYAYFVRPPLFLQHKYKPIPGYLKLFEICLQRSLFKRLTFSFYSFLLKRSLQTTLVKLLLLFIFFAKRLAFKSNLILPNICFNYSRFSLEQLVVELVNAGSRLYEIYLDTGLITFKSLLSKNKAKLGLMDEAHHSPVAHFGHYYPFNFSEKNFTFRSFKRIQYYESSTKMVWLPRRFLKQVSGNKLNIGYLLNNFFKPSSHFNKSLFNVSTGIYPCFFKLTNNIYDNSSIFSTYWHKFTFNPV